MITTLAEVKALNNISVADYDDNIIYRIPYIQASILEYLGRDFISFEPSGRKTPKGFEYEKSINVAVTDDFTFIDNQIIGSDDIFTSTFKPNDNIMICGSVRNDGYFTVTGNDEDTTITCMEDFREDDDIATIYLVVFPRVISQVAAYMIGWDINGRKKSTGLKSQNLRSVSYTYQDIGGMGYPKDIVAPLNNFSVHRSL